MVTFKNVKSGTYYLALHAWNRTSENKKKVFSLCSEANKIKEISYGNLCDEVLLTGDFFAIIDK